MIIIKSSERLTIYELITKQSWNINFSENQTRFLIKSFLTNEIAVIIIISSTLIGAQGEFGNVDRLSNEREREFPQLCIHMCLNVHLEME